MARLAFVFPGQGSQQVGMGHTLFETYSSARRVFEEADTALGESLSQICFTGPDELLRQTINAQPALLATSVAAWAALTEEYGAAPEVVAFAGHSLGEYSALVAAGVLSLTEAIRLVQERGRLMQEAGAANPGGMCAVLGLDDAIVEHVCSQAEARGIVVVANYNAPGQVVISGETAALEEASRLAKAVGARRVLPLAVSGAFHSPLVISASEALLPTLQSARFDDPKNRIFANVSGLCYASATEMPGILARQIISPVRWTGCVQGMADEGAQAFVEVGHGQVLTGLIKRICPQAATSSLGDSEDIKGFALWQASLKD
jgi:[acyl-carrier-protein] S-malonyltransferase